MSDPLAKVVAEIRAEKDRLLGERDKLDYRINALSAVMILVQQIECAPVADHGYGYEEEGLLAEKPVSSPDAPAPQPEVATHAPPAAPASHDEAAKSYKVPYVTRPAAAATGKKPIPPKVVTEPITYEALIARGAEWGITGVPLHDLLAAVNRKAARAGQKPYALQSRSP